ncbi:hypothetical protein GV791_08945 [Nocardia cyriacigeorgica]|uniref:Sensor domain-containing protein n=1 Tax=Nocardia cyriacigeorgica TaxID=135487 RepID=A0A6P1CJT6_9NOCA|nr:hypothetical protein [Nocardia cyriacigeorgica]NEW32688.1 hypothetical protein [Nocardia cyriacigeorgica]
MKARHTPLPAFVLALAIGVAMGCSTEKDSSGQSTASSSANVPALSAPSTIRHLSQDMLLTQHDLPPGDFHVSPIEILSGLDQVTDACDPAAWVQEGDQETAASVSVAAPAGTVKYAVELFTVQTDPDLTTWESDCLPYDREGLVFRGVDLTGTPEWAVATESTRQGSESSMYSVWGYHRGVLVHAYVSGKRDDLAPDVQAIVPRLFEAQTARLNR